MPSYRRVAVIGAGPSGLAAVKALSDENVFDTIRVFERRDRVGGIWIYDPKPDVFPSPIAKRPTATPAPQKLPVFTIPKGEDVGARTGIYDTLDSNVGAKVMAFSHTPFPEENSAESVRKYGANNPTRPYKVIEQYIEDGFKDYRHHLSLNTTVENVKKVGDEWVVTLRKSDEKYLGKQKDYWWQEKFNAVVVATGHYNVPFIPAIWGIDEAVKALPHKFEHSKFFRSPDDYVGKKVIVVGGSISAADLVVDLAAIVKGPLYLSQRGRNELLDAAFNLPAVVRKPPIKSISAHNGGVIEFEDGSTVENFDKIIFGTGYKLSYPFLNPEPVTKQNRLAGFYQHIFKIGDPSIAVVGQVKAALSFRVYEYQAVAAARFLAGRAKLPSVTEQQDWETKRLEYKGPTNNFHEIKPNFAEYFNWLVDFSGKPAEGTKAYELPAWDDKWGPLGLAILSLKDAYWKKLGDELGGTQVKAKL
ncbi:probable flavin-containing monooxygenase [Phialocephala subalpina]|uniref:Probable flavin-containing monooxygenase n=1 Tax=Phialocephala subalpina TaxID=576137 RepID=A0A1L7XSJ3_9HELO|nr:probable flavin-containing monooxygenase [Phialocephala subalpina]